MIMDNYIVFRKNTHFQFLLYLHEWWVDFNKNCSEYTRNGSLDSANATDEVVTGNTGLWPATQTNI